MSDSNQGVWNYFVKHDKEKKQAQCKICDNIYSYKTTIHNLKKHLELKHGEQIEMPVIKKQRSEVNMENRVVIWGYFTKVEGEEKLASCNVCNKNLSYKTTITNLKHHLRLVHEDIYAKFMENEPLDLEETYEEDYLSFARQGSESPIYAEEVEVPSVKSTRKKRSYLWNFFARVEGLDRIACCNACNKFLSYKISVTNLKQHLKQKHNEAFTQVMENLPLSDSIQEEVVYVTDETLGGQEPLDYISMYWNPDKPEENIPPHWHYISFGLSDLHGDGRVHPPPDRVVSSLGAAPSGYGLELTLRLAVETESTTGPPLWPAALLQALARYIFTTGNKFCAGDHISWHAALDAGSDSRVRHLLVADDPLLATVKTAHGTVAFLQMVGCTGRELRAAQRGSGFDVLKLISEDLSCGGAWLVTRVRRRRSARGVRTRVSNAPAHLAGVSARVHWLHWTPPNIEDQPASPSSLTPRVEQQIKETLQRGLSSMSTDRTGPEGHMSTDSFEMSSIERALPSISDSMQGSWREDSTEYLDGVHLMFNAEGVSLLPLAINGRVSHGRHFTWRWCSRTVTFVGGDVTGALPTAHRPYATRGTWLQVLIPKELIQDMSKQVSSLARLAETDSESDSEGESEKTDPPSLPLTLAWPKYRLKISVVHDHEIL